MGNSDIWAPLPQSHTPGLPSVTPPPIPPPAPRAEILDVSRQTGHALAAELGSFCESSGATYAAIVSENGVRIAHAGPARDLIGSADEIPALAVGAFFATRELAARLGESHFEGLYQQGANHHLFLSALGRSHLLLASFGALTNVGIVRLCATASSAALANLLDPRSSPTSVAPRQPLPASPSPPAESPSPPPLPFLPKDLAASFARPAPTDSLSKFSPLPDSAPFFPPGSAPSLSTPTIAAFERRDAPTRPFPSG